MPDFKKGDKCLRGLAIVTNVTKVPEKDKMSLKNPFGFVSPYRVIYKYVKGPLKGQTGSFGSN